MKAVSLALLAVLWLSGPASAEDLLKPSTTPPPVDDVSAGNALEAEPTHEGEGVIRAIDVQQGSVTIAHGPVPDLKWPAMIMPFKASAAQLRGLAIGDAVEFRFTDGEMDPQIVSIRRR
ncbi:cation efflux system protein CusF precursor [Pseudomonas sp. SCT]|uniref:copper-binding protein n=1 Tax=Pseudomonas sp. (strain SCT) TaxID=412955 RepID=UPI000EC3A3D2|nr:copper-binding protein [Pseudomonas sp. SCT]GCA57920.1 cation efflux system protein CusF precursor [Pseudomonas sp. SCT]